MDVHSALDTQHNMLIICLCLVFAALFLAKARRNTLTANLKMKKRSNLKQ